MPRLLWGFLGAVIGSYLGIVVTFMVLFLLSVFHMNIPFNHGLALLIMFGGPTVLLAVTCFVFPLRARALGTSIISAYARTVRTNRQRWR